MGDLYRSQATSCTAARHNLDACKHSKDAREAGCQDAQECIQEAYKEQKGAATAAAVEQAGPQRTAANAAADGEADAAGRQDDEVTAPGAAAVDAGAEDTMQPQDAHANELRTLSEEECEEANEGCNSHSVSPAPDHGGPDHSGSISQDTAEHEATKAQKEAESQPAKQKCSTAASASATSMGKMKTDSKEKFEQRFKRYYGQFWHGAHIGGSKEIRYCQCNRRHWAGTVCSSRFSRNRRSRRILRE